MKKKDYLHLMGGTMILLSLGLAHFTGNGNWLWLTAFVGVNQFQAAFTKWCPAMWMLDKAGIEE